MRHSQVLAARRRDHLAVVGSLQSEYLGALRAIKESGAAPPADCDGAVDVADGSGVHRWARWPHSLDFLERLPVSLVLLWPFS